MQQNMMGQNIIITEPSRNLRALGRNALAGKWQLGMIAVLVYTLCLEVPTAILNAIFGTDSGASMDASFNLTAGAEAYNYAYNALPDSSLLSDVYIVLVTGALELGITLFFLAMFRKQIVGVADVFLGFEKFGKALGLMLFQGLFIVLWTLAFIVPGIIAAIRYSQAFFILADDPNKGIRQCMNESKMMMKGNKTKYFCLSLSFIGWIFLSAVPVGILEGIANLTNMTTGIAYAVICIIQSLFMIPLTVYTYSTMAGFYEILAGHLIKETEPAPVMPGAVPVTGMNSYAPVTPAAPAAPAAPQAPDMPTSPSMPAAPVQQPASSPEENAGSAIPKESASAPAQDTAEKDDDDFFIPKEL